jgi:hypothetical protein
LTGACAQPRAATTRCGGCAARRGGRAWPGPTRDGGQGPARGLPRTLIWEFFIAKLAPAAAQEEKEPGERRVSWVVMQVRLAAIVTVAEVERAYVSAPPVTCDSN